LPLFNYSKPGPGVSKNAPPKKRIVLFFEILGRKFFPLIRCNLLFLIPVILVGIMIFFIGMTGVNLYIACLPFVLLAPFLGGLTYITRNYAREEHAFILSDFLDTAKSNWKQLLIHGAITYLFVVAMNIAIKFYAFQAASQPVFYILFGLCLIASAVFLFMQYYITLMIITFELNLRAIYRNALILAFAGFKQNILVTLVLILFFAFLFLLNSLHIIAMLVAILLCVILLFSFLSFLINFAVYPVVERYLIQPYYTNVQQGDESGETETNLEAEPERRESEYIYENGRLIKKSLFEQEKLFDDTDQQK
jgi:uncharacterized membrane protein YesL